MAQRINPASKAHDSRFDVMERNVTPDGRALFKTTPVAVSGPRLYTVAVKVVLSPRLIKRGEESMNAVRSADDWDPQHSIWRVSISIDHPPRLPPSRRVSSSTNNSQAPFGSEFRKMSRLAPYGAP